jgi:hypothetical protein
MKGNLWPGVPPGARRSTPDPSQWNKMPPLTIVAFFFRKCITNEKLDFFMQRITDMTENFSNGKFGDFFTFVTWTS